jgi:hypothetical protein
VRVDELAVVVDLAGEVRVVLVGRFEDDLLQVSDHSTIAIPHLSSHLGSICKLVGGQVDLAKRAFPNQAAEGIVSDRLEVLVREFAAGVSGREGEGIAAPVGSYSRSSWYECAS